MKTARVTLAMWLCAAAMADVVGEEASPWAEGLEQSAVNVYSSGSEGYHTYRIPSLLVTPHGTLLAFAEGRKAGRGDAGDIDMLVKRSTDNGITWSKYRTVWNDGGNTCGNPCPVVDQHTGRIWLPLTWNRGSDHERQILAGTSESPRRFYLTYSDDDGVSWAEPAAMPHLRQSHWRWYATGPDKGIQLTRGPYVGRLVIPCNHSDHSDPEKHPYRSHVVYSDNHGATWKIGGVLGEKTNESTVAERSDGSLLDNLRSYHGENRRAVAISKDGGQTWGAAELVDDLIEPVCQASMLRYSFAEPEGADSRSRLMFSNPASKQREKMTLRLSYDDGDTWPVSREIYRGSAAYSCLARLPDGRVGLLFERDGYRHITFLPVDLQWLEAPR